MGNTNSQLLALLYGARPVKYSPVTHPLHDSPFHRSGLFIKSVFKQRNSSQPGAVGAAHPVMLAGGGRGEGKEGGGRREEPLPPTPPLVTQAAHRWAFLS